MGHIHGANRHDVPCFPERLDDDIAEANPVRFLAACVDELDLKSCGVHRAVPAATGRPGYAPSDLLNLYLYGDLSRLRSSRRLEQETHSNVALLWLLKKLRPDHKTRADCRKDNLTPIRQGCRPFTLRCKQWDLFGADLVALDGSTCRAVNATERNFTPAKLTKLLAPIDERVAASRKALERSDDQDNRGTVGGAHVDALAAQIEARTQRTLRSEGGQAQLPSSGQAQRSLTAPERRAMKRGTGRGTEGCDNVQTAVDAQHKRIVACEGTHDPGDRDWRSPMARQAKEGLDCPFDAVADVGDYHGHEGKACLEAGIPPSVSRPLPSANEKLELFSKEDGTYDRPTETSQCPAGARLTFRVDTVELGRHIRSDATSACRGGAITPQCTRKKGGRRLTRGVEGAVVGRDGAAGAEPTRGDEAAEGAGEAPMRDNAARGDHDSCLLRGLEKVRTECSVTVLAYNLRRVLNLVEMPRLLAARGWSCLCVGGPSGQCLKQGFY